MESHEPIPFSLTDHAPAEALSSRIRREALLETARAYAHGAASEEDVCRAAEEFTNNRETER